MNKEPKTKTSITKTLQVRLLENQASRWKSLCSEKGQKTSEALKELIVKELLNSENESIKLKANKTIIDSNQKQRVEVRLKESEYKSIQIISESEGCSIQHYIINCIREKLLNEPQFAHKNWSVLKESNYQLRTIGKNINQIAKRYNEGRPEAHLSQSDFDALLKFIDYHTCRVGELLDASLGRWGITHE
jgi:hypothetical protein